jgi:hypothetical protein
MRDVNLPRACGAQFNSGSVICTMGRKCVLEIQRSLPCKS